MNTTIAIFQCKIEFYFTEWTPQSVFSLVATATRENAACGVHSATSENTDCGVHSVK